MCAWKLARRHPRNAIVCSLYNNNDDDGDDDDDDDKADPHLAKPRPAPPRHIIINVVQVNGGYNIN